MTTTTLNPNATYQAGGTVTGAASADAALSDASDSSYVTLGSGFGSTACIVEVGTVTLPAGAVTKSGAITIRALSATGDILQATSAIGPGAATALPVILRTGHGTATLATTYVGTTWALPAMTQAQVDAIEIIISDVGSNTVRAIEASLALTYALAPSATTAVPTGTVTSSTSPTMTWVYTAGSDGDVQSQYQIRVFTAAQYGIGGFNPATSPATYDSGVVLGSASSATIGPLPNGATYRAYILVYQNTNGTPQPATSWAFTGFTMSVTTADILSVVGTPSNSTGAISVVVTRVTAGSPPTWTTAEVQRSDDGGTTWAYVRSANGAAVSGTTYTVVDYEAGNGTSVLYRARATYLSSGSPITGAWVSSSATSWTASADWLKHPSHPSLNRTVIVQANPSRTRPRPQGVMTVIGRSDPVVVSDVRGLMRGTLTFVVLADQDAIDLLALLAYDVLFFQPRPGARIGQMYVAVGDIDELPVVDLYGEPTTTYTVPFVQVLAPIDTGIS